MRWWERLVRWDDDHRLGVDAGIAVGLALIMVPTASATAATVLGGPVPEWLPTVATLVMALATTWRRARPTLSAAVVLGTALLHLLLGALLMLPGDLLVLVALYSVTVHGPVWAYRTAVGGAVAGSLLLGLAILVDDGVGDPVAAAIGSFLVLVTSLSVMAWGLVRRARRESFDALVDRARRLEVERDQQSLIAAAAERARIAREMHDIVAHSLSVMVAQADGGRYASAQDPAAAQRSLVTIAETGRAALSDMRRLLGVLRTGDAAGSPGTPGTAGAVGGGPTTGALAAATGPGAGAASPRLAPQPGVEDVDALVEQVRAGGLRVSVVHMGSARTLPPGTGLTVYRIAQESLTNVLKHAGPSATVTVLLQWAPSSLVLEVTDDGRGAAAETDGAGQGVLGMRERAAMLGGTLAVGPRPGGGYRVRAEIPLPPIQEDR